MLYGATQPSVEYLFDDSISTLQDDGDSVRVTFERAAAREFDLVIGADGLHSNVRRLVFGPEEQFVKRLGTHAAIFTVPNFLELDYWQTWHYGDSTMAGVYSARNNTEARAALAFMDTELRIDYRDTEAQFAELQRRMAEDGWVRAQLLHYMRSAPRRNVADPDGSLVAGQGSARWRRWLLLLALVGAGDQRRPAGCLHPGRRTQGGR